MELIKHDINFDFMGKKNIGFVISAILIILSIAAFFARGGFNMGIDFTGGSIVQIKFLGKTTNANEIKGAIEPLGFQTVDIQQYGNELDNEFLLRLSSISEDTKGLDEQIKSTLERTYGAGVVDIRSSEMVGPQVGGELRKKGVNAIIAAIVCIFFYIAFRFEFKFASGAVAALIHDVIITIGAMCLLNKEFNLTIVAALLTVVGYSINDTVVVYDRIRENLRKSRKSKFETVINRSINETLSRTILTSLTTLLVLVSIFIFGGGVIHNFAYAMLVGVIVGTYSSIFIASPIVVLWQQKFLSAKAVK